MEIRSEFESIPSDLRYYVVRHGRGYFELGRRRARLAKMEAYRPLGLDGPEAWTKARRLYREYREAIDALNAKRAQVRVPVIVLPEKKGPLLAFLLDHVNHTGDACLIPPVKVIGASGYSTVKVQGKSYGSHRLMLLLTQPDSYFLKAQAAHRCGNPTCVNPKHLYWATAKVNQLDRHAHGTMAMGRRSRPGPASAETNAGATPG